MRLFTDKEWFSLPLKDRKLWWETTDYGRREASRQTIARYVKLLEAAKTKSPVDA